MDALTRLPAVTIDGTEYPTYRDGDEEVMQDLDIGRALELARPRNIRKVIAAHSDELGDVRSRQERTPGQDGPASEVYYLTEAQALYIAAKCRTKAAAAQLKRLIAVYMEARKGNGAAAVAIAQGARHDGDDADGRMLAMMESAVHLQRQAMAQKAELQQLAALQAELAQAQTAQAAKVDQLLAGQQAAAAEFVAPRSRVMVLPELSRRTEVVRIVRSAATASGKTFEAAWRIVYDMLRDLYHIDVRARARINKKAPLDICEELGLWDRMLAICGEYLWGLGDARPSPPPFAPSRLPPQEQGSAGRALVSAASAPVAPSSTGCVAGSTTPIFVSQSSDPRNLKMPRQISLPSTVTGIVAPSYALRNFGENRKRRDSRRIHCSVLIASSALTLDRHAKERMNHPRQLGEPFLV